MLADIDFDDPCLAARELRKALAHLIAGEKVYKTEFQAGQAGTGTRRTLEFHKADIPALRQEISRYEALCRGNRARMAVFKTSKGL